MSVVRLGAVSYLNTKPLVDGLQDRPDLFSLRFDLPSQCASLLHDGQIDVGLIPAIEYLRGDYFIVPDIAIGSDGPVSSVAVFSRVPVERIETLALDTSSKTSVALTRILCAHKWRIAPTITPGDPNLRAMLAHADAALVIGDPALDVDPLPPGVEKIDLGTEWKAFTRLPFVYAMWAGRAGAVGSAHVAELQAARDRGVGHVAAIAQDVSGGDAGRARKVERYLRDNLKYPLGEREIEGLERFYRFAAELGLVAGLRPVRFYSSR
ncbi:MAG TPA: menaquinone biosynthesis protein [Vicinamibacterales bacterium]|nr:menaquinone biosynthesis protein [Vicinamibacterales bacterium]